MRSLTHVPPPMCGHVVQLKKARAAGQRVVPPEEFGRRGRQPLLSVFDVVALDTLLDEFDDGDGFTNR